MICSASPGFDFFKRELQVTHKLKHEPRNVEQNDVLINAIRQLVANINATLVITYNVKVTKLMMDDEMRFMPGIYPSEAPKPRDSRST